MPQRGHGCWRCRCILRRRLRLQAGRIVVQSHAARGSLWSVIGRLHRWQCAGRQSGSINCVHGADTSAMRPFLPQLLHVHAQSTCTGLWVSAICSTPNQITCPGAYHAVLVGACHPRWARHLLLQSVLRKQRVNDWAKLRCSPHRHGACMLLRSEAGIRRASRARQPCTRWQRRCYHMLCAAPVLDRSACACACTCATLH